MVPGTAKALQNTRVLVEFDCGLDFVGAVLRVASSPPREGRCALGVCVVFVFVVLLFAYRENRAGAKAEEACRPRVAA